MTGRSLLKVLLPKKLKNLGAAWTFLLNTGIFDK